MANIIAIIPARLDSSRLPGKQLLEIAGKPVLYYLTERLKSLKPLHKIVLATTERDCDLPLVEWANRNGIASFCGSVDDVLGRFLEAARYYNADYIIRANGDSPLLAPEIIITGLEQMLDENLDFITGKNRLTGLPAGMGPEIITYKALELLDMIALTDSYREHITTFIFDNKNKFRWKPITTNTSWISPEIRLTLDTSDDYGMIERVMQLLLVNTIKPEKWTIEDIISNYKTVFKNL